MASLRMVGIGLGAVLQLLAVHRASAQDTSSRRIDSTPRIVLRPDLPSTHRPGSTVEGPIPTTKSDRDRRLDLELDLEERRDAMRDNGRSHSDYVALIACVVGSGAVLVSFLWWASRRRGR